MIARCKVHNVEVEMEWADDGDGESGPHPYVESANCPVGGWDCNDHWEEVKVLTDKVTGLPMD